MLLKKKSLVVATISSIVISLVLVLTLIGYLMYIELKGEEYKRSYQEILKKVNARLYSKYMDVSKLTAGIEQSGALKGKSILEGIIKNKGERNISDLIMRVRFLDKDGAIIYEVIFRPNEPPLGVSSLTRITIPYLYAPPKLIIKPRGSLPFKQILTNCPDEIVMALRERKAVQQGANKWSGRLISDFLSVDFQ